MAITVGKVLTKVFGSRNERLLKRYRRMADQITVLEPKVQAMGDLELRARSLELHQGLMSKKLRSAEVLPEAFAIMRESMDRHIGIRAIFDIENKFDPDQFDDETLELYDEVQRKMISDGVSWQRVVIPPKIYDAVRKLYPESRPPFRARCFDVQLIGGIVLYEGKIAEMATGEGKTFVGPLACFMKVLEGNHTHVVTVNDYLVRRDAMWVMPAFENLGFTVGYIQSDMEPGGEVRRKQYACDITYGTNAEFGFDYLRDNMKERADLQVQGPLHYAIVDEVDSILIDEARTPLIISGGAHDDAPKYRAADTVARKVIDLNRPWAEAEKAVDAAKRAIKAAEGDIDKARDKAAAEAARHRRAEGEKQLIEAEEHKKGITQYVEVEMDRKTAHLTHEGIAAAQDAAGIGSFYVGDNMEWPHLMSQALRAHMCYERDKDYIVERGQKGELEVIIVDENTGRKMAGRQWSEGLHQSTEAKEKVPIKQETQTLATITLQNFFKLYRSLAGMTGTAQTEAEEFAKIYRLEVVTIPTNRPIARSDHDDRVFRTEQEKWMAIVDEIKEESDKGRPVLVGTTSVEKSESLATLLTRKFGIEHEVLNAKQHEREAQIIAKAGHQHANVRGETVGNVTIATNMAGRGTDIKLTKEVTAVGGLHVIGTERHTARRIDNQLRGRSGRQGDPGSSRFYVSLQDELMAMFAGEWTIKVLGWLGMEEGMAIEDKRISKGILRAQKKVEERNFLARKNLLDYDEVMDLQRTTFYGMRQQVLEGRKIDGIIWRMISEAIEDAVKKYIVQDYVAAVIAEWARINFDVTIEVRDLQGMKHIEDLEKYIKDQARAEAETLITATLVEYLGEDEGDPSTWDTKGLSSWAMSRFHVNLPQNQIRRMETRVVEEKLRFAAVDQIEHRDCAALVKYLDPHFAETELANWARDKFGVEIKAVEMTVGELGKDRRPAEEISRLIEERARAAYRQREREYPIDHTLTFAFGGDEGNTDNAYSAEYVRQWAKNKYGLELTAEQIRGQSVRRLRDELLGLQEAALQPENIEKQADELLANNPTPEALAGAFNARYGMKLTAKDVAPAEAQPAPEEEAEAPEDQRTRLMQWIRQFYRKELTDLEQFVLIQILDQSWKDHLYAMDLLKSGIGLQAFAERDPRVLYKMEGYTAFQEMMAGVRDKVTDLIFRARVVGRARSVYNVTSATHEEAGGYGVRENIAATAAAVQTSAPSGEMQEAAKRTQGEAAARVKPIVRDIPKVGRNDLCPCGSGKKYKKCCGQNVV